MFKRKRDVDWTPMCAASRKPRNTREKRHRRRKDNMLKRNKLFMHAGYIIFTGLYLSGVHMQNYISISLRLSLEVISFNIELFWLVCPWNLDILTFSSYLAAALIVPAFTKDWCAVFFVLFFFSCPFVFKTITFGSSLSFSLSRTCH